MKKLVIYPGRFQPFHKGHAQVFQWLKSKFGDAYIATSDKVEAPKSPFNFQEKKQMMRLAGVPAGKIKQVLNPYMAREILKDFDPKTTVLIFAVSQKDMDEDPRFSFQPTKSGKPGYLQPYASNEKNLKPFGDAQKMQGYVIVTPTFTFDVLGKPATSASELRKQFVSLDNKTQKEFIKDLFGKYDADVHKLMKTKIGAMQPKPKTIKQLREEVTRKELAPMLDSFVSFASDKLGLKSMPTVRYKSDDDDYNSFAAYNPSSNELSISTVNRHPMDIFRSVAHELVHHKQNEDGRLGKDIEKEGATGSDIENEANSEAGKIMRWFAKEQPQMFGKSYVIETNTAAMGGVRGLGNVTGEVSPTDVPQYVLDNQAYTNEIQNRTSGLWTDNGVESYWLDKKGSNEYQKKAVKGFKAVRTQLNEGINDPGKLKAIFLAGGPGSGKDFVMNSVLQGEGLREVNSDVAFEYLMRKNGLDLEMPDEEKVERDIVRGRAKNITKEKERLALAGRLGLIINGTADDLEKIKTVKQKLENDGYETMMVFVNTSNEVSRQRNVERGKMGNRKVPDGTDKQGVPDGSEDIRQEKWDLAQKNIGELQKIFGNKNFAVIDNTADMRKVSPEEKQSIQATFDRVRRMAQQFVRAENQNPAAKKWIEGEAQKRGITQYQEPKRYKTLTQTQQSIPQVVHKPDNELMAQARRLGLSYYGFGRFGRRVNGINKVMFHSKGGKLVRVQLNEDLDKWFREKWVRFDTKGNIKGPCAREPGEGKPKCRPLASARSMSKEERAKSARRKRREDPVADRPGKGNKPINVQTEAKNWAQQAAIAIAKKKSGKYDKEGKRLDETLLTEKNKPTNPALWSKAKSLARSKFDVYPSAYANGWASKWYKSKGGGWKTVSESNRMPVEEGRETIDMEKEYKKHNRLKKKVKRPLAENLDNKFETFMEEHGAGDWGTPKLTNLYKKDTPGQKKKKLAKEDNVIPRGGLPFGDGIGPTTTQYRPMTSIGYTLSESIESWMNSAKTQHKFIEKYGDLAEEKLIEAAIKLEEAGYGSNMTKAKKSVGKIKEGLGLGYNDMSPIAKQNKDHLDETSKEDIIDTSKIKSLKAYKKEIHPQSEIEKKSLQEESPAWTRREGQSASGGLNRKGIASYRRANPGSKLSMAVTTKPSKLKKGSKAANRRKSFCARMGGMKKRLTSAKTARDPNSRINKALRKWNCEE
jgi:cytidyltransferase-like protein